MRVLQYEHNIIILKTVKVVMFFVVILLFLFYCGSVKLMPNPSVDTVCDRL